MGGGWPGPAGCQNGSSNDDVLQQSGQGTMQEDSEPDARCTGISAQVSPAWNALPPAGQHGEAASPDPSAFAAAPRQRPSQLSVPACVAGQRPHSRRASRGRPRGGPHPPAAALHSYIRAQPPYPPPVDDAEPPPPLRPPGPASPPPSSPSPPAFPHRDLHPGCSRDSFCQPSSWLLLAVRFHIPVRSPTASLLLKSLCYKCSFWVVLAVRSPFGSLVLKGATS